MEAAGFPPLAYTIDLYLVLAIFILKLYLILFYVALYNQQVYMTNMGSFKPSINDLCF